MDELLNKFESRMEQELSLNPTQTAHARQLLSDLMDELEPQQPDKSLEKKIREVIIYAFSSSCTREECPVAEMNCAECAVKDVLVLLPPQQPVERIAKMLQSGDRVRLWYGRRFLDHDSLSHEWVVMDSQENKGLGCSLYVGADLGKALDVLEREGK